MELLTKENILNDNKIDLVIGDTHGDFTAILNVLNSYLKTNIKFQYYEDLVLSTVNKHITLNTSLMKHKDFINSDEKFVFKNLDTNYFIGIDDEKNNKNVSEKVLKKDNKNVSEKVFEKDNKNVSENNSESILKKDISNFFTNQLNNIRLIILGDIFDTNNYLTLRTRGEKNKIEFKPLNTDTVIEYTDNYKIFGNFVCDYNNEFFSLCQQLVYKLLVSLEDYVEIKYIFGNHELSSFNYYPENIQNFIINKFRSYYYNQTKNTFYCHFYNKTDKTEINDIKHNLLNIDELVINTLKDYKTASKNKKNKFYFKLMNLKKSLIQVVDMEIIDKLENKFELMADADKIIMKHKSIFDDFIKRLKPICFVGHWDMNNSNVNKDKTIYFLDRDLSIIHARTIQNKETEKIGIILNCQYCVIDNMIKHFIPLFDYEFYINDPLTSEYITEKDYDKYVIFNLKNALILDF